MIAWIIGQTRKARILKMEARTLEIGVRVDSQDGIHEHTEETAVRDH